MTKILFAVLTAGILAISANAASAQTSLEKNPVASVGGASQGYNMTITNFDSIK
jgi:hypothetical protein